MLITTPRVAQLDAHLLDDELVTQLSSSLTEHKDELAVVLKLLLYKLTIGANDQSYGMFLMNLKYKNLRSWKKHTYILWLVLGKYLGDKLSSLMYDQDSWRSVLYKRLERTYQVCDSLNFLLFLVKGSYPNLAMRLLNIKMSYNSLELAKQKGNVSYEFQNRQLIWNTFLEFILFILPILQNSQINTIFTKLLAKPSHQKDQLEFKHLKERECAICFETLGKKQRIVNPVETSCCGAKYCYICLVTKLDGATASKDRWICLECGDECAYGTSFVDIDTAAITCTLEDEQVIYENDYEPSEHHDSDYHDDEDEYEDGINEFDLDDDLEEEMEELEDMDEYEL